MDNTIRSAFVWSFIQRFGTQAVEISVSILLARILLPEEFGLIGMIMIVIAVGQSLTDAGMTSSLIRKKSADTVDYSTVFFLNFCVGIAVYLIIYFIAPYVAQFYEQPILVDILRVFSITIILNTFSAIQSTICQKELRFKFQFKISFVTSLLGGACGIYLAKNNYGVWSLVYMHLVNSAIAAILYWLFTNWKPALVFSVSRFKEHFKFGINLTISGIINRTFDNLYNIVIGKNYNTADLGLYTRAQTFMLMPITNVMAAMNTVAYPVLSSLQDDEERLQSVFIRILKQNVFLIAPMTIGLIVLAEPLFLLLFTEKWIGAVPYFKVLCVTGLIYPVHSYNLNVFRVKGRSDIVLKVETIKRIVMAISIFIVLPYGILALVYSQIAVSIITLIVNTYYSSRFTKHNLFALLADVIPIMLVALCMGGIVHFVMFYLMPAISNFLAVSLGTIIGALAFIGLSYIIKMSPLFEILDMIKSNLKLKKPE